MKNWQPYLIGELADLIKICSSGLATNPDDVATRLRQIAYRIDTNQKNKA